MALPKQVQAQIAEIEELEKKLKTRPDGDEEPSEEGQPPEDNQAADTDADDSAPKDTQGVGTRDAKPADEASEPPADDYKQRYLTLRGKYDAEVPRLHQQVRDLTDQLDQLRKQVDEKAEKSQEPEEPVSYVTDADRAEFGEELIDVQRRVAKEVAREYEAKLSEQQKVIDELREQVANTGNQVGQMSFAQRLQQLVPDFEEVDQDQRWIEWLNEYDPVLRGPRRQVAEAAFKAGDADGVAHYVNLFKQSIAAEKKQPEPQPRQAELEKQVAPNRSAGPRGRQGDGQNSKVWTQQQLAQAWDKVRVLNTRGRYDEAAKLEAEVTAAYMDGRVRA